MCLIAFVPAGKSLTRAVFDKANDTNPDGIGVMSELGVEKFFGHKQLKRARNYVATLAQAEVAHAVHWRYATHGSRGLPLTHPFKLPNTEAWVMHNGVIGATSQEARAAAEDVSDTSLWVSKLIEAPATYKRGDSLEWWGKVGTDIGQSNKVLIMYPDSEYVILNQDSGVIVGDIWYSNQYSLPYEMRTNNHHFMPARLQPPTPSYQTWQGSHSQSGIGGSYYGNRGTSIDSINAGEFGSNIYYSVQHKEYGFWTNSKFQVIECKLGKLIDPYAPPPKQQTIELTPNEPIDDRKCPVCLRFKSNPPMGFMVCWCTDERVTSYLNNKAAAEAKTRAIMHGVGSDALKAMDKPAMPSGPTLDSAEHPEAKPAVKTSNEVCEHGESNWENCRECISELENEGKEGLERWLAGRAGHNWHLRGTNSGTGIRSLLDTIEDEVATKVIYLPRASDK